MNLARRGRQASPRIKVAAWRLHDVKLVDVIGDLLARHRIPAERRALEITETTIAADLDVARGLLPRPSRRGDRFSIDDFGIGDSSLAVLRSLAVGELKVDRRFGCDLTHAEHSAIVDYSVHLGRMLSQVAGRPEAVPRGRSSHGDSSDVRFRRAKPQHPSHNSPHLTTADTVTVWLYNRLSPVEVAYRTRR